MSNRVLEKIAMVTINVEGLSKRDMESKYNLLAKEITKNINDINTEIINMCKANEVKWDDKNALFRESVVEYLEEIGSNTADTEAYERTLQDVVSLKKMSMCGNSDKPQGLKADEMIDLIVEMYLIAYEDSKIKYMKSTPMSDKSEEAFNKLNNNLPMELKVDTYPTNAYDCSELISRMIKMPTEKMLARVETLSKELNEDIPRDFLLSLTREQVSSIIDKLNKRIPATEGQRNAIARVMKQLGEVYIEEEYADICRVEASNKLAELNCKLLVKLSAGQYTFEEAKAMNSKEVSDLIIKIRGEQNGLNMDREQKEKFKALMERFSL